MTDQREKYREKVPKSLPASPADSSSQVDSEKAMSVHTGHPPDSVKADIDRAERRARLSARFMEEARSAASGIPHPYSLSRLFKLRFPSPSAKNDAAMAAYGRQTTGRYLRYVGWMALREGRSDDEILTKLEVERGKLVAYTTVRNWINSEFPRILSGRA